MRRYVVLLIVLAVCAAPVSASAATRFHRIAGFPSPGTPAKYNQVGILEVGPRSAPNILVLNPGTSASAAYFAPLARDIVRRAKGWQVWAVERRENLLEDHSVLNRAKRGQATGRQLFDYYLGWLTDDRSRRTSSSSRTRTSRSRASGACEWRSRTCGAW